MPDLATLVANDTAISDSAMGLFVHACKYLKHIE
jgi:hypothetical protein